MFTGFPFALSCSTDLLGSIAGVYFIEHITDCGKLIFSACAVHTVIDGNEVNTEVRKKHIRIHSNLEIVTTKTAHIFYYTDAQQVMELLNASPDLASQLLKMLQIVNGGTQNAV